MTKLDDVAAYILEKAGPMSTWKLQKLVYYSQAWSLVWDEKPLFTEPIEAWANGPVVRALYNKHRRQFTITSRQVDGDPANLSQDERDTVDSVIGFYGEKSGQWLSELTHKERPWLDAREGLRPGERSNREITVGALADYYGSL